MVVVAVSDFINGKSSIIELCVSSIFKPIKLNQTNKWSWQLNSIKHWPMDYM